MDITKYMDNTIQVGYCTTFDEAEAATLSRRSLLSATEQRAINNAQAAGLSGEQWLCLKIWSMEKPPNPLIESDCLITSNYYYLC